MGNAVVMLADERHGIVVAGDEMPDVEIGLELLRHGEQPLEAFHRRDFRRIGDVGVVVPAESDPYFSAKGASRGPIGTRV